jgi:hypothetical protein
MQVAQGDQAAHEYWSTRMRPAEMVGNLGCRALTLHHVEEFKDLYDPRGWFDDRVFHKAFIADTSQSPNSGSRNTYMRFKTIKEF